MEYAVYYDDGYRERRLIGTTDDYSKAWSDVVRPYLDENGYKSPYIRVFTNDLGEETWDVGSHDEFFIIIEVIKGVLEDNDV